MTKSRSNLLSRNRGSLQHLRNERRQVELALSRFEREAARHIQRLRKDLESYDAVIAKVEDMSHDFPLTPSRSPHIDPKSSHQGQVPDQRVTVSPFQNEIAQSIEDLRPLDTSNEGRQAKDVLELMGKLVDELGRPVSKRVLTQRLSQLGYILNVTDPPKFLQKTLWSSKKYQYSRDLKGWWPIGRPLPSE